MLRAFLAALALSGCAIHDRQGDVLYVRHDEGGIVQERERQIQQLRAEGVTVIIGEGATCLSACTMYLGMETTRVHPTARLCFHGVTDWHLFDGRNSQWYTEVMAVHYYPRPIRDWYFATGADGLRVGFECMSGAEAIEMGVRAAQ